MAAGMAAWTTRTCFSSTAMGMKRAARMMTAGARIMRTSMEPRMTFGEGFSEPTRSMMDAPVMRMARGKAPIPSMERAVLAGPGDVVIKAQQDEKQADGDGDDGSVDEAFPADGFFTAHEHDADGPDGGFHADAVDEDDGDGGDAPEDFHDGDGGEAEVLAAGGEGERAPTVAGGEADAFPDEVADADAGDDEAEAEARASGEGAEVAKDIRAQHAVQDEAGHHHGEDDVHDAAVVFPLQGAGFAERGTSEDEEVNRQNRYDNGRRGDQGGGKMHPGLREAKDGFPAAGGSLSLGNLTVKAFDVAELDKRILPGGDHVRVAEDPARPSKPFLRLDEVFLFVGERGFGIIIVRRIVEEIVFFGEDDGFVPLADFQFAQEDFVFDEPDELRSVFRDRSENVLEFVVGFLPLSGDKEHFADIEVDAVVIRAEFQGFFERGDCLVEGADLDVAGAAQVVEFRAVFENLFGFGNGFQTFENTLLLEESGGFAKVFGEFLAFFEREVEELALAGEKVLNIGVVGDVHLGVDGGKE